MTHSITLRFRDEYLESLDSSIESTADADFHANAADFECESSDNVIVTLDKKTSLSSWLTVFHEQHGDCSGLCQRYRILAINSAS